MEIGGGALLTIVSLNPWYAAPAGERGLSSQHHDDEPRDAAHRDRPVRGFIDHCNQHRPHRSVNQRAPTDDTDAPVVPIGQPIQRTTTCTGLINEYRTTT